MSEIRLKIEEEIDQIKSPATLLQDDVAQQKDACAAENGERNPKTLDCEVPIKKRKTRRGKSKRRYPPYIKSGRKSNKVMPKAPYNSNQFLLEDHGDIEDLNLKSADQISTTSPGRTRDSSFSVDSDREFYSSPDDEEQFLIKDFVDQYESVQAERLQSMSKDELIQEYLMLESKLGDLTKRMRRKGSEENETGTNNNKLDLQKEVERLTIENEALRHENAVLRSKTCSSDSEDSETDSNDSCSSTSSSSTSSSSCSNPASPVIDYSEANGHSAEIETV